MSRPAKCEQKARVRGEPLTRFGTVRRRKPVTARLSEVRPERGVSRIIAAASPITTGVCRKLSTTRAQSCPCAVGVPQLPPKRRGARPKSGVLSLRPPGGNTRLSAPRCGRTKMQSCVRIGQTGLCVGDAAALRIRDRTEPCTLRHETRFERIAITRGSKVALWLTSSAGAAVTGRRYGSRAEATSFDSPQSGTGIGTNSAPLSPVHRDRARLRVARGQFLAVSRWMAWKAIRILKTP